MTTQRSIPPPDVLLEREADLAALRRVIDEATTTDGQARGAVVLVSGEAGSGKSTLLRRWLDQERDRTRTLVGWCDDLATARAFAPLHDVAGRAGPLRAALDAGDAGAVFDALVATLDDPLRPVVLVIEDAHWADDATLDAIRHVARRIASLGAVLVVTYRDDEVGSSHALTPVLGGLTGAPVHRIRPGPLSVDAVACMAAGRDVDPAHIVRATGGNAFLVTALLSDPDTDMPASVRDVVMGCVARVGEDARRLVITLAEVPGVIDMGLVDALAADDDTVVEAEEIGLLVIDGERARFRHEIARLAVRDAASRAQRRASHRRVLDVLLARSGWTPGSDPATAVEAVRLAHFAAGAGDVDVLVAIGPHAAAVAHGNGAHDIADRIQRAVLDHAYRLGDDVLATLERQRAWTLYSLGRHDEAHDVARRAVAIAERTGDDVAMVHALVTAARVGYMANDPATAGEATRRAVAVAERVGDPVLLGEASVAHATHAALVGDPDAVVLADRAIVDSAAAARDDLQALARTYRAVGMLHTPGTMQAAIDTLDGAVVLARRSGSFEAIGRSVLNMLEALAYAHDERLRAWIEVAREMDDGGASWDGFRANVDLVDANQRLGRGDWGGAEAVLDRMRAAGLSVGVIEVEWALARARLAVRRGEPDVGEWVARARRLTDEASAQQFDAWMLLLQLEYDWLRGYAVDADAVTDALATIAPSPAWTGELAVAARRAGVAEEALPVATDGPWAPGAGGDAQAAIRALREAGQPYHEALALIDAGGEDALRAAVVLLDRLGAAPAAAIARERLAALGVTSVPRGPSRATRSNPAGLTPRQVEVLGLLVDGRANTEIAAALTLSVRTVEDHVSAVLAKLGVSSREEAAVRGRGLLGV